MPKAQIIKVEHHGHAFINSEHARLLCTGMYHHWILLIL